MAGKGFISINLLANTKGFQNGMQRASMSVSNFSGIIGRLGLGLALIRASKQMIDYSASLEKTATSFKIMLGSAEESARTIDDLNKLAAKTPFMLDDITTAAQKLIGAKGNARGLRDEIKMLGDIAAVSNVPIQDMANIYAKAMNQGILQAEELNQISDRGIPIYRMMAEHLGVAANQVKKLGSEGKIGFKELQEVFQKMTSEGGIAFGAMEEQSRTFSGQLSTLNENYNQLLMNLNEHLGILPTLTAAMKGLNDIMAGRDLGGDAALLRQAQLKTRMVELREEIEYLTKASKDTGWMGFWAAITDRPNAANIERLKKELAAVKSLHDKIQQQNIDNYFDDVEESVEETTKAVKRSVQTFQQYDDMFKQMDGMELFLDEGRKKWKEYNKEAEKTFFYAKQAREKLSVSAPGVVSAEDIGMGGGLTEAEIQKWGEIEVAIGAAQRALQTFGAVYSSIMANNMAALNAQHEAEMASLEAREGGTANYAEKLDQLREKQRKERNEELRKQAQIKKAMAVFDALLAIPRAYLEGLTAGAGLGGPALGGVYAGLAAAQMAAIAAVPTPSFAIGTTGFRGGLAKLHEGETILPPRTQVISKGMSKMRTEEGRAKIRLEKDEVVIALNKLMGDYRYKL